MAKNHYFNYVIGRSLQAARNNAKVTKKTVYTHFDIPRKTYDRYENGESSPDFPLVLDIWMFCGVCSVKDLGDEIIKGLEGSAYGRTLLKWLTNKKNS